MISPFLSNFYPVEIEWDGETYPSVEHAYLAEKLLSTDNEKLVEGTGGATVSLGSIKVQGRTISKTSDANSM